MTYLFAEYKKGSKEGCYNYRGASVTLEKIINNNKWKFGKPKNCLKTAWLSYYSYSNNDYE